MHLRFQAQTVFNITYSQCLKLLFELFFRTFHEELENGVQKIWYLTRGEFETLSSIYDDILFDSS